MVSNEKSTRSGPSDHRPGAHAVTADEKDDTLDYRRKAETRKSARHSHNDQGHHHSHTGHHRNSNNTAGSQSRNSGNIRELAMKRRSRHEDRHSSGNSALSAPVGAHRMSALDRAKRKEDRQRHSNHGSINRYHQGVPSVGAHMSTSDTRARRKNMEERRGTSGNSIRTDEESSVLVGAHFSTSDRIRRKEDRLRHSNQSSARTSSSDRQGGSQPVPSEPLPSPVEAIAVDDGENEERLQEIKNELKTASDERIRALESQIESMNKKEPVSQENQKKSFCKRNRYCILIALVVIIAGVTAAAYFLYPRAGEDGSSNMSVDLVDPIDDPTHTDPPDDPKPEFPTTTFPPSYPMSLYPPNSQQDCDAIALGQQVSLQQFMVPMPFDVEMDVSLIRLATLAEIIPPIETSIQQDLAPRLADCGGGTRRRLQTEPNIVGNALVRVDHQADQSCNDDSAVTPCIRLVAKLTLYLKGQESTESLAQDIRHVFEGDLADMLGLADPIAQIDVMAVSATTFHPLPAIPPTDSTEFDYSTDFISAAHKPDAHAGLSHVGPILDLRINRNDPNANGEDTITFRLSVPQVSWLAVGISRDGSMLQTEAVIAKPEEGTVLKYRLGGKSPAGIIEMQSQTLIETSLHQGGGNYSVLTYTKIANEAGEIPIHVNGTMNTFVAAYGRSNAFGFHAGHRSIAFSFLPDFTDWNG